MNQEHYEDLRCRLIDILVEYSASLIDDGVAENTFKLSNGFTVNFKDRKKKR